ncbi:transposase [Pseudarthrobacter siccitolerans]
MGRKRLGQKSSSLRSDRSDRGRAVLERVENDKNALLDLIATVAEISAGREVWWATGLNAGRSGPVDRVVVRSFPAAAVYPRTDCPSRCGDLPRICKSDANDARIIADQARMRPDLQPVRGADPISVDLRLEGIRRVGLTRLAERISTLDAETTDVDAQITELFRQHGSADVLLTMPGFGPVLAATFLANIGGNVAAFDSVDRLASVAGLAPVPRDSARISGNLHRPRRFNRRRLRTCYLAALSSLKNSPASRTYYDRKRGEGKSHKEALIALARRRINGLWAMLRDHTVCGGFGRCAGPLSPRV